jgi:hypothetical protein
VWRTVDVEVMLIDVVGEVVIGLIAEIAVGMMNVEHEEEESKEELSVELHMKDKMQGYPFLLST